MSFKMRSLVTLVAAAFGLATATCALADPASLLAPDDPVNASGWRPPPSPTAGLKSYAPVEVKDWIKLNQDVTETGGSMGGMGGMKGMGGMDAGKPAAGQDSKGGMPGMPGMGGGK